MIIMDLFFMAVKNFPVGTGLALVHINRALSRQEITSANFLCKKLCKKISEMFRQGAR